MTPLETTLYSESFFKSALYLVFSLVKGLHRKNVKDVKVGDRVYPYPILVTGDRKRAGTIGGFSEYIYCPCPEWEKSIYHIDDSISDKVAALIEPFTVGCRAARRGLP